MKANTDFIIVHTISERRVIQGDDVQVKRTENRTLKKYVGSDETVVIPDGIDTIGLHAFAGCESIKTVIIPENVKTIACRSFFKCTNLESVRIPKSVKKLGNGAFEDCEKLHSVIFEDDVPRTGCEADIFYRCRELTIYAAEDSYMKRYAQYHRIAFSAI